VIFRFNLVKKDGQRTIDIDYMASPYRLSPRSSQRRSSLRRSSPRSPQRISQYL
jgi:hypothetical protein